MLYKAKSKIEGMGLFTDSKIEKDEYIGTFKTTNAKYITKFSIHDGKRWRRAICILKYANHSINPNAYVDDNLNMYALKTINPKEEITWSYGEDWQ